MQSVSNDFGARQEVTPVLTTSGDRNSTLCEEISGRLESEAWSESDRMPATPLVISVFDGEYAVTQRGPENTSTAVAVLFFAALRDRAGTRSVNVPVVEGMTVDDAVLAARKQAPRDPEPGSTVMLALNGEYVTGDRPVSGGDELALIPPVSGGADELKTDSEWVFITGNQLDPEPLNEFVTTGVDGAVVLFLGVTRDHNEGRTVLHLEYEAYQPMAENKIKEIIGEMRGKWELGKVAIAHRTGRVDIGETSMVVAVGSAHRRPAFEASLYFVDRLKELVPIWKREYFEGGDVWIGETPGVGQSSE